MDRKTTRSNIPTVRDPITSVLSIRETTQRPVDLSLDAKKANGMVVMTPTTASSQNVLKMYLGARCCKNTLLARTRKRYAQRQVAIVPPELIRCANLLHCIAAAGVTKECIKPLIQGRLLQDHTYY